MFIGCLHVMPNGRKCHSPALRGKPFCFHHAKLHFRKTASRRPGKLAEPLIEDVSGIQAEVAKALAALCSPLTDTRRAGLLLYGLHLAADLSKRNSDSHLGAQSNRSQDGGSAAVTMSNNQPFDPAR